MKLKIMFVVLVSFTLTGSVMAGLTLVDWPTELDVRIHYGSSDEGYGTIVGREFIGTVLEDSILDDDHQVKFTDLCLELDEHINDSGTYEVIEGAVGYGSGKDLMDSKCGPGSEKIALLVFKYLHGKLRSSEAGTPDELAKAVQESIWLREDEVADYTLLSSSQCYHWNDPALGQDSLGRTLIDSSKVTMVNLVDYYGDFMQSRMTAIVPAPATIFLAGLGSSWVGFMRRKRLA